MARMQCQSCGGTYDDVLPDGLMYFHRCPPLSRAELAAAVDAGAVTLPKGETVDEAILRRTYERANRRDENVTGPAPSKDAPAPIVSHGAGAIEIAATSATVVVVDVPVAAGVLLPPV